MRGSAEKRDRSKCTPSDSRFERTVRAEGLVDKPERKWTHKKEIGKYKFIKMDVKKKTKLRMSHWR